MKNFVQNIKNLIFSQKCSLCHKIHGSNTYICSECYEKLRKKWSIIKNIENFYFLCYYDPDVKTLIADFKLKNRKNLGREISFLMRKQLKELIKEKKIDVVLPVPISEERIRERGFNQVEELLDFCDIKYEKIKRAKNTKYMYGLNSEFERRKNIKSAFKNENVNILDKNILIVDDIVTTGSTIKEMIKEITKYEKPKDIYVFSIAISKSFKG